MAEDDSNFDTPPWAEPHLGDLAKIHDLFDAGSGKIRTFIREHSLKSGDFEKFIVIPGLDKDHFRKMITDSDVDAYLRCLSKMDKLNESIHAECVKYRPIEERFGPKVVAMEEIELPPDELFHIHDGEFPVDREEFFKTLLECRQIRNTASHISDAFVEKKRSKAKQTWNIFFTKIVDFKFSEIMDLFVTCLRILEFIADGTREIINKEYVETQLRKYTDKSLTFSEPELIKRALGANKWDKYIEVEHKQEFEGEAEETMAINHLDYLMREDSSHSVVEINGLGGLGKTKLAREYILRSVDMELKYRPKRYDYYIYYTAKSKKQGEIGATYGGPLKESPGDWQHGGGDYIEDLVFENFIERIQKSFNLKSSDLEERIIEYFAKNKIFVLLDNFEDVSKEDIPRYKKFFSKFPKDFNSRFVITSRRNRTYGGHSIVLDRFNKSKAIEMLSARYQFEIKKKTNTVMTNRLKELLEAINSKVDLIQEILDNVKTPELTNNEFLMTKETLEKNLRHPLYLRFLANLLVNSTLVERTKGYSGIADVLVHIIDEPEFKFWEWHEDVINWMLEHAFNNIKTDPNCLTVLQILLRKGDGTSLVELFSEFQINHPDIELPQQEIQKSLAHIKSHREFLDERSDSNQYFLTSSAKKFLRSNLFADDKSQDSSEYKKAVNATTKNNSEEQIDFGLALQQLLTNGLKGPQDFVDAVFRLQEYSKIASKDTALEDKAEKALCKLAKNLDLDEHMDAFLDFLHGMNVPKARFDLICQQGEIFARDSSFDTLGENSQSIAMYLLGTQQWPDHTITGPEKQYMGHIFILMLRIERSGLQKNIASLFSCIDDLLGKMGEEDIEMLLTEYAFREEFSNFLSKRRLSLEWSQKKQNIFDTYGDDRNDIDMTKKFSHVQRNILNEHWTLKFHPDGLQNLDSCHGRIFTVHWDLIAELLTVFVSPPSSEDPEPPLKVQLDVEELFKPLQSTAAKSKENILTPIPTVSFNFNDSFATWTMGSKKGQPGLNVNPIELACDIFMVREVYNQSSFDKRDKFARAQSLKKLYKDYYRGSNSSHSVAFMVGFHCERNVTFNNISDALITEFKRRLKNDKDTIALRLLSDIQDWEKCFQELVDKALSLLTQPLDEAVKDVIQRRKKLKNDVKKPVSDPRHRAWADSQNNKPESKSNEKILKREDCKLHSTLKHPLKQVEGHLFLSRSSIKKTLIQRGDLNLIIKAEKKMVADYRKGETLPKDWQFVQSWLNSIVDYIWSSSSDEIFKKYSYDESFIEHIENHHFQRFK